MLCTTSNGMNVIISTKNISLDNALEIFIQEKIGGLEKFLKDPRGLIEARIQIGLSSKHHRSGRIYYAEVNLKVGGKLLRATCQHEDLRNAIVDVKNELQQQIRKFRDKKPIREGILHP